MTARQGRGKGIIKGPIVMVNGKNADRSVRKQLIENTIQAYFNVAPQMAMEAMQFVKDITQAEHKDGHWNSGEGYVKIRLPQDLFFSLRHVFEAHIPDDPSFGDDDDDLHLLFQVCPNFTREGINARQRRGRGNKR